MCEIIRKASPPGARLLTPKAMSARATAADSDGDGGRRNIIAKVSLSSLSTAAAEMAACPTTPSRRASSSTAVPGAATAETAGASCMSPASSYATGVSIGASPRPYSSTSSTPRSASWATSTSGPPSPAVGETRAFSRRRLLGEPPALSPSAGGGKPCRSHQGKDTSRQQTVEPRYPTTVYRNL